MKFRWTFQASTDFLCRMSEDEVRLLGDSGVSHMGFGTESTSELVLKLMNKRHQRVDEMYETARKAQLGGIRVTFNLIFGYPGETEADRIITFRTMSDIGRSFATSASRQTSSLRIRAFRSGRSFASWACTSRSRCASGWTCRSAPTCCPGCKGEELAAAAAHARIFPAEQPDRPQATTAIRCCGAACVALSCKLQSAGACGRSRYSFPWELWLATIVRATSSRDDRLVTGQELPKEPGKRMLSEAKCGGDL